MFTPAQLFGGIGPPPDPTCHTQFLERARSDRKRGRGGPTLLAVVADAVVRLVNLRLAWTEAQRTRDEFLWQCGAVRRYLDGLPAETPEVRHLEAIVVVLAEVDAEPAALRECLDGYVGFLEHEGRLDEALDVLVLAAHAHGPTIGVAEFTAYARHAGRLNRLLARWDTALACYEAAEEAARSVGDEESVLRARLGRANVLRGQGNLPLARSAVEEVIAAAAAPHLSEVRGDAYADLGAVLDRQGRRLEALEATYRAFRTVANPRNRMQVLGDLGIHLAAVGAHDVARLAFDIVIASEATVLVRMNAMLELMDLEAVVGNRTGFESRRVELEERRELMPPSMLADYRYKSGIGFARFGEFTRARMVLTQGLRLAETHRLNVWYFRIERALSDLTARELHAAPQAPAAADPRQASLVAQTAEGLRAYRARERFAVLLTPVF